MKKSLKSQALRMEKEEKGKENPGKEMCYKCHMKHKSGQHMK